MPIVCAGLDVANIVVRVEVDKSELFVAAHPSRYCGFNFTVLIPVAVVPIPIHILIIVLTINPTKAPYKKYKIRLINTLSTIKFRFTRALACGTNIPSEITPNNGPPSIPK